MTWIVIVDNGCDYSDHMHAPLIACDTRHKADEAIRTWQEWYAAWPRDEDGMRESTWDDRARAHMRFYPASLGAIDEDFYDTYGSPTVAAIEIPDWSAP